MFYKVTGSMVSLQDGQHLGQYEIVKAQSKTIVITYENRCSYNMFAQSLCPLYPEGL